MTSFEVFMLFVLVAIYFQIFFVYYALKKFINEKMTVLFKLAHDNPWKYK